MVSSSWPCRRRAGSPLEVGGLVCIMMRNSVLSVSPELLGVPVLPVGSARWSLLHGLVSSLVHASGLLAGGGETAELSMVVLGGDDPVDTWVASDGLVGWVHEDDLKELEAGILTNPVGVEDAHVAAFTLDAIQRQTCECARP